MDAPDDEVADLLAGGPDAFVATRTARSRALRAEGRRAEAAALAKVRKPLRITWALVDVQHDDPGLVERAVAAAEALEQAQAGRGGRVRPLLSTLRDALDEVGATAPSSGPQAAEVGLAARQVLADAPSRRAWAQGRLLTLPEADTDGGRLSATGPPADEADDGGAGAARTAREPGATADEEERAEAARARQEEGAQAVRARQEDRAAAAAALSQAEAELEARAVELDGAHGRHAAAQEGVEAARSRLAAQEEALAAAKQAAQTDP